MRIASILLLIVILCSCGLEIIGEPEFASFDEAITWVSKNIGFESCDYYPLPSEVFESRESDCVGYCALLVYFVESQLGGGATMEGYETEGGAGHMVVRYQGELWEPQTAELLAVPPGELIVTYTYQEYIWIAMTTGHP